MASTLVMWKGTSVLYAVSTWNVKAGTALLSALMKLVVLAADRMTLLLVPSLPIVSPNVFVALFAVMLMSLVSSPGICDATAALMSAALFSTMVAPATPSTDDGEMLIVVITATYSPGNSGGEGEPAAVTTTVSGMNVRSGTALLSALMKLPAWAASRIVLLLTAALELIDTSTVLVAVLVVMLTSLVSTPASCAMMASLISAA